MQCMLVVVGKRGKESSTYTGNSTDYMLNYLNNRETLYKPNTTFNAACDMSNTTNELFLWELVLLKVLQTTQVIHME